MLAIVEHQQHPPARHVTGQLLRGRLSRLVLDTESRRDRIGEVEGIIDRCEADEPGAVRKRPADKAASLDCQARLPDTARTCQRDEA